MVTFVNSSVMLENGSHQGSHHHVRQEAQQARVKAESKTTISFGSATALAKRFRSTDQETDWTKLEEKAKEMGVSILVNKKARPIEAIREVVKVVNVGKPIQGWLGLFFFVLVETRKGSRGATASAVAAWDEFAIGILGYELEKILPPRLGSHAVRFVAIFNNGCSVQQYH